MRADLDLTGTEVLIVDDDDDIVDVCRLTLGTRGAGTGGASDAGEAVRRLESGGIDVVVTDLVMPGLTGRRLLDWIEETHPALPVVVMSGVPDLLRAVASRPNVRAVLDKPFEVAALLEAVAVARGVLPR